LRYTGLKVAGHNEERLIEAKLLNCLRLGYPRSAYGLRSRLTRPVNPEEQPRFEGCEQARSGPARSFLDDLQSE
jgi:hypothetical protein